MKRNSCRLGQVNEERLTVEYYNEDFLLRVGDKIGKSVKVDQQTVMAMRGKYARICIEVDLTKPFTPFIWIDQELQAVEYEGLHLICFGCGKYGHSLDSCPQSRPDAGNGDRESGEMQQEQMGMGGQCGSEDQPFGPWMLANSRPGVQRPSATNQAG